MDLLSYLFTNTVCCQADNHFLFEIFRLLSEISTTSEISLQYQFNEYFIRIIQAHINRESFSIYMQFSQVLLSTSKRIHVYFQCNLTLLSRIEEIASTFNTFAQV